MTEWKGGRRAGRATGKEKREGWRREEATLAQEERGMMPHEEEEKDGGDGGGGASCCCCIHLLSLAHSSHIIAKESEFSIIICTFNYYRGPQTISSSTPRHNRRRLPPPWSLAPPRLPKTSLLPPPAERASERASEEGGAAYTISCPASCRRSAGHRLSGPQWRHAAILRQNHPSRAEARLHAREVRLPPQPVLPPETSHPRPPPPPPPLPAPLPHAAA